MSYKGLIFRKYLKTLKSQQLNKTHKNNQKTPTQPKLENRENFFLKRTDSSTKRYTDSKYAQKRH